MRPRYLPPDTARGRGPQGVVSASGAAERPPRAPVIESAPCGCASRRRPAHACAHEVQRTPGPLPGLTRAFFDPRGRCRDDRGDARTAVSCPPPLIPCRSRACESGVEVLPLVVRRRCAAAKRRRCVPSMMHAASKVNVRLWVQSGPFSGVDVGSRWPGAVVDWTARVVLV